MNLIDRVEGECDRRKGNRMLVIGRFLDLLLFGKRDLLVENLKNRGGEGEMTITHLNR
jgi:hypothetical protein